MEAERDLTGFVLAGRYRLNARRSGSIGDGREPRGVFDATDIRLDTNVVVRLVPLTDMVDPGTKSRKSPIESRRAIQLRLQQAMGTRHPSLAPVLDWGDTDIAGVRCIYSVLGLLPGGSLREMLDRSRLLTPSQALVVGLDICRALHAVHQAGWVHGDIRPAAIVFDAERRARLGGLDALPPESIGDADLERARYAAPELGQGSAVSEKSDVYSLALVLVEAITGQVPFAADSVAVTLSSRVDKLLPVSADLGPLASVLERAARPDAESRFSAREFGEALVAVAKRVPKPTPVDVVGVGFDELLTPLVVAPAPPVIDHGDAGDPTGDMPRPLHTGVAQKDDVVSSDAATDETEDPTGEIARARVSRRRGLKAVVAFVVVAVIAGGVGAYFALRKENFRVPVLVGLTEGEARNLVVGNDWEIIVQEGRSDLVETGEIISTDPAEGVMLQEGKQIVFVVSLGPTFSTLEDVTGKTEAEATARLTELGLVPAVVKANDETIPQGVVISWAVAEQPTAIVGDEVVKGTTVNLTVSDGPAPRIVPDLVGMTLEQATTKAQELGLVLATLPDDFGPSDPGLIGGQVPVAGESLPRGGTLSYWISKGPQLVRLPYFIGLYKAEVEKRLTEAGFVIGEVEGIDTRKLKGASIAGEEVANGDEVPAGSTVDLLYYGG
jgi:serine/threonine-protein kinase